MITYIKDCYHQIIVNARSGDFQSKGSAIIKTGERHNTKKEAVDFAIKGIDEMIEKLKQERKELENF